MTTRYIEKKATLHFTGCIEDIFTLGQPDTAVKEIRANVPGEDDPAIVYSVPSASWYLISNVADRRAFNMGTLDPIPTTQVFNAFTAQINNQLQAALETIEFEKEKAIAEIKLVKAEV